MTAYERKILTDLIYDVLQEVPRPQPGYGTQSACAAGYIGYAKDAMVMHAAVKQIILNLLIPASDEDREPPEDILRETVEWIARRRREGWDLVPGAVAGKGEEE